MAPPVLFSSDKDDFPFHVRDFDLATDYDACVDLLRLSMHSIRAELPNSKELVEPSGVDDFINSILASDMQPGEAGIPAHYTKPAGSGFWVAVATQPRETHHCLPDVSYPFIAGTLALRPSRACAQDKEYPALCAERGFDFDKEATLNRMVTADAARRRGVARALLQVAEEMARASGYKGLHLGTASTGRAAVSLYLNNGFTVLREVNFPMKVPVFNASTGVHDLVEVSGAGLDMRKAI